MSPKHYSVIISPSDGKRSYHLTISSRALWGVATGLFVVVIGFVFLVSTYGNLLWKVRGWDAMTERVLALEQKEARILQLEDELAGLREMDRKIRQLVGLPEPRGNAPAGADTLADAGGNGPPPGVPEVTLEEVRFPGEEEERAIREDLARFTSSLPWPVEGFVSSKFGEERASGGRHSGVDIAAPRNTLVETPLDGQVASAGWHGEYGYVAVIDHGAGLVTVYGHNAKLLVREGDDVDGGDAIAFVGSTGHSSAPHLHFEVRKDGFAVDPSILLTPRAGS